MGIELFPEMAWSSQKLHRPRMVASTTRSMVEPNVGQTVDLGLSFALSHQTTHRATHRLVPRGLRILISHAGRLLPIVCPA